MGRLAFARGNSAWATSFNANLLAARNMHSMRRTLIAAAPVVSRFSALLAAGEAPITSGFAEQFRDMSSLLRSDDCQDSESDSESQVDVSLDPNVDIRSVIHHGGVCEIWSLSKSQIQYRATINATI